MNISQKRDPEKPERKRHGSLILSLLCAFVDFLYNSASRSLAGFLFGGKKRGPDRKKASFIDYVTDTDNFMRKLTAPVKRFFNRSLSESLIVRSVARYVSGITAIRTRTVGIFAISFGLYTSAVFVVSYFIGDTKKDFLLLIIGIASVFASIPLFSSGGSVSDAISRSRVIGFLLFDVLGIRREYIITDSHRRGNSTVAFLLGTVLGLSAYFLNPLIPVLTVPVLAVLFIVVAQPETGVILTLLLLPFLPTMAVAGMIILTAVCYFLKLIQGKRRLVFEKLDISILIFMVLTLFGGIVSITSSGSIRPALMYFCLSAGYFLTANLLTTAGWTKRAIGVLLTSMTAVALIGIYENYFGKPAIVSWIDTSMFSDIENRVVSTFANPNVLAEFLILLLPLSFALVLTAGRSSSRFGAVLMLVCCGVCLVFTWSRGAWLGILFGMLVFLMMCSRKTLVALFIACFGIPLLPLVLPDNIIQRFMSIGNLADSSTSYRFNIWRGVFRMLPDCFLSGIGIGEEPFSEFYVKYSLSGIEAAPHSHSLFLQVLVSIGITGLIALIAVLCFYVRESVSFCKNQKDAPLPVRLYSSALFAGICAVLVQGLTDYVWYNYRIFALFWLLIGLTVALRRSHEETIIECRPDGPYTDIPISSVSKNDSGRKTGERQ